MKKVIGTIGAIVGFLGLAAIAVFFMEATTGTGYALLPGDLLADLSALRTHATPTNQLADVNAVMNADAGTSTADNGVVLASSTTDLQTAISPSSSATQTPSSPTDNTPVIAVPQPATPTLFNDAPVTSPDLPEATATITVTPTAPAIPPPPGPITTQAPSDDALALPYSESILPIDTNWQTTWGTATMTGTGAMQLSAAADSIGGAIYLKNSAGWANYTMNAMLNWSASQTFGLVADYRNASDYVVCEYTKAGSYVLNVQLLQYAAGNEIALTPATPVASGRATARISPSP